MKLIYLLFFVILSYTFPAHAVKADAKLNQDVSDLLTKCIPSTKSKSTVYRASLLKEIETGQPIEAYRKVCHTWRTLKGEDSDKNLRDMHEYFRSPEDSISLFEADVRNKWESALDLKQTASVLPFLLFQQAVAAYINQQNHYSKTRPEQYKQGCWSAPFSGDDSLVMKKHSDAVQALEGYSVDKNNKVSDTVRKTLKWIKQPSISEELFNAAYPKLKPDQE